ncbi:MAG: hypothetical protein Q8M78_04080, partial [Burkholderiaceae bacterium]|nr:hypothetical protein [Burkholderiaceae bacterium]
SFDREGGRGAGERGAEGRGFEGRAHEGRSFDRTERAPHAAPRGGEFKPRRPAGAVAGADARRPFRAR